MTSTTELTIALANFDRHVPFFLGWLPPADGFRLRALDVGINTPGRDGTDRHGRMLRGREFDIAEVSLASYIMARSRGADLTAVPVFPRRLFSQNHIYVKDGRGIDTPRDLIGKRIALRAFQVSLSVLAKGDLKHFYGVPWEEIEWLIEEDEQVAWTHRLPNVQRMPAGKTSAGMLASGEVDALIDPRPPAAVLDGLNGVRPLFADQRAACLDYYQASGTFPVMHLLVMRNELAERFPSLPAYLIEAWEDAQRKTQRAYEDYAYTAMPFGRLAWQDDVRRFGDGLWRSGLEVNRAGLERFIAYLVDQHLLEQAPALESLFHASVLDGA
jgi:4,5-dihydroxyphthalate decarboxylase